MIVLVLFIFSFNIVLFRVCNIQKLEFLTLIASVNLMTYCHGRQLRHRVYSCIDIGK